MNSFFSGLLILGFAFLLMKFLVIINKINPFIIPGVLVFLLFLWTLKIISDNERS